MKKLFTIVFMIVCSIAFSQEKYSLLKADSSPVIVVDSVTYKVNITIGIHPVDGIGANFSKDITVDLPAALIKAAVDKCEKAVSDYILYINQ